MTWTQCSQSVIDEAVLCLGGGLGGVTESWGVYRGLGPGVLGKIWEGGGSRSVRGESHIEGGGSVRGGLERSVT